MNLHLSPRHALLSAAAAGFLPIPASAQAPRLLAAGTRTIEVNRKPARVFGLAPAGRVSGLVFDPGERFLVDLVNNSGEPSIIHWHGQTPPPDQDGVTDTGYATPLARVSAAT